MPRCKIHKTKFIPKVFNQKHCMEFDECIKAEIELRKAKKWKKEKAEMKNNLLTITELEKIAKIYFQKWIRIRDKNLPCISCGIENTNLWDGGHYKKAEIYSGVIFDEHNCHKQCRKCNRFLGGNELNYREGLINRYGLNYVLEIEKKSNELKNYKYTKDELKEIKIKYANLILKSKN